MDLKNYIRSIPDYPKKGILFRDITTLIKNAEAFRYTNDKIIEISKKIEFDKVAAIESRGFVFAAPLSHQLKKHFILLRKKNKLPADTHSVDFELEYGKATVEVHKYSINKDEKILIVDDEPDIIEILKYNINNEGYYVKSANNGKKAVEKAKKLAKDAA